MKTNILILLTLIQCPILAEDAVKAPDEQLRDLPTYPFKPTVRVVGEKGEPISDALVKIGIFNLREKGDYKNFEGATNKKGEFAVDFQAHLPLVPIEVTKDGYYRSRKEYEDVRFSLRDIINHGGFRPWDPKVDVVLKKIGKPIPMYVRGRSTARIFVPNLNEKFSFDLLEWDWLPPNGKGKIADWVVEVKNISDDKTNSQLTVTINFPNELDGMIRVKDLTGTESRLRSPRTAPGAGYNIREVEFGNHTGRDKIIENDSVAESAQAYIMRIRTVKDTNGKIISSQYGKLIEYPGTKVPIFDMLGIKNDQGQIIYGFQVNAIYINPSVLDQNLEYNQTTLYPNIENYVWDP